MGLGSVIEDALSKVVARATGWQMEEPAPTEEQLSRLVRVLSQKGDWSPPGHGGPNAVYLPPQLSKQVESIMLRRLRDSMQDAMIDAQFHPMTLEEGEAAARKRRDSFD